MVDGWAEERILITVKTYPVPSGKETEISCTAGITERGGFIRLYPIPFRLLEDEQQFTKYAWVKVPVRKATRDARPESFRPDIDRLVVEDRVGTDPGWTARRAIVSPLVAPSIEALKMRQEQDGTSLGIIRPREITGFYWRDADQPDWTPEERAKLTQTKLWGKPVPPLEKIPKEFHYQFRCDSPACTGHDMQCFDWEMGQAFRRWRTKYPDPDVFEEKFMQRFRDEFIHKFDTHFFVGTVSGHPKAWTIIGIFYPPRLAS